MRKPDVVNMPEYTPIPTYHIKDFRKEKRLTLQEMSEHTNLSISLLSKMCNNISHISEDSHYQLKAYYGVNFYNDVRFPKLMADKYKARGKIYLEQIQHLKYENHLLRLEIQQLKHIINKAKKVLTNW